MKVKRIAYYYIKDLNKVAKSMGYSCQIYDDYKWEYDYKCRLNYGIKKDMSKDNIEEITYEEASKIMADQTVKYLIKKWQNDFLERKKRWEENALWPAKYVELDFELYGMSYTLFPEDIYTNLYWNDGFMESIHSDMQEDLEKIGAINIYKKGFLD